MTGYFLQNAGVSTTNNVNISKRPNNIEKHKSHLEKPF